MGNTKDTVKKIVRDGQVIIVFQKAVGGQVWGGNHTPKQGDSRLVTLYQKRKGLWEANYYKGEDRFIAEGHTMVEALKAVLREVK